MSEEKKTSKLEIAGAICGTIAACGAYSIVALGIGGLNIQPRSKLHKWVMKYGTYALATAAGTAAFNAVQQDFNSIKSLLGIKDAIKKGVEEAKKAKEAEDAEAKEEEEEDEPTEDE